MQPSAATVFIDTFGCQMNVLDSELVRGQLEALGYRFVDAAAQAEVVLLNTCSVRALSEQKVWSQLGRLGIDKRARPQLTIGVLGCMAEREGTAFFRRAPCVDVVCGPSQLDRLPSLLAAARLQRGQAQLAVAGHTSRRSATLDRAHDGVESLDLSRAFSPSDGGRQAYVRITRGCNKFCAFCVVPRTRGPEVHRPPAHIVDEVRRLVESGVQEVTLLGQTVNHYLHREGGRSTSFADLLVQVHDGVPALRRLRFITSYPRDFGDDALDAMAASPRICRYLHIPAQSGSNAVLQAMNRGYTVEAYTALLARARARMPDICLAGDMIVGFPTETDADHAASVALLRQARYKSCFVFKYSPRPDTVAQRRFPDAVPDEVKRARNQELLAVQAEISLQHHTRQVGQVVEVLVEGHNKLRRPAPPVAVPAAGGRVEPGWEARRRHAAAPASGDPAAAGAGAAADVADGPHERLIGRSRGDEIVAFDGPPAWVGSIRSVQVLGATPLTMLARA